MKVNFLLTGAPGVGKTSVIRRVVEICHDLAPAGFYTEEMREDGRRRGFRLVRLDGPSAILADRSFAGPKVGSYGVDVSCIDRLAIPILESPPPSSRLLIIDEIGRMEMLSERFGDVVASCLAGPLPVVGSIARGGGDAFRPFRARQDVEILEVTLANRDSLAHELVLVLRDHLERGHLA